MRCSACTSPALCRERAPSLYYFAMPSTGWSSGSVAGSDCTRSTRSYASSRDSASTPSSSRLSRHASSAREISDQERVRAERRALQEWTSTGKLRKKASPAHAAAPLRPLKPNYTLADLSAARHPRLPSSDAPVAAQGPWPHAWPTAGPEVQERPSRRRTVVWSHSDASSGCRRSEQ